ncbi:MAG: hypothetical protein AB1742_05325 [bacterium]
MQDKETKPRKKLNVAVCLAEVTDPEGPLRADAAGVITAPGGGGGGFRLDARSEFALEIALRLKRSFPETTVHAVTLGPARSESVLRRALAAGADAALRVWDASFDAPTPLFTARALAAALKRLRPDAVLCGSRTTDSGTGLVGPALAAALDLPFLGDVSDLHVAPAAASALAACRRRGATLTFECPLPALFSVEHGKNCPPAPLRSIIRAGREKIPALDREDLKLSPDWTDAPGPGARVVKLTAPKPKDKRGLGVPENLPPRDRLAGILTGGLSGKKHGIRLEGAAPVNIEKLFEWLAGEGIIQR